MAAKQLMKPRATAKKPASQKSIATKPAEATKTPKAPKTPKTATAKAAKATASKVAKPRVAKAAKATTAKVTKPRVTKAAKATTAKVTKPRVTKAAKATTAKVTKPRVTKAAKATAAKVTKPRVTKAAKATAAKVTKTRVTKKPRAVAGKNSAALNGSSANPGQAQIQGWMINEIEQLRQENAALLEKARLFDQIAQVTAVGADRSTAGKTTRKTTGRVPKATKVARVTKAAKAVKAPAAKRVPKEKVAAVAKAPTKSASPSPAMSRKARSGGSSILQDAADADVNRTYKSCWPIVFKIDEWNQKNPGQLAKVSQTMLNKSGVNFSRAKGFMDNYGDLVESYHQQIGLSKANSGKFNEVYEFIRAALGKGKK
jgi:hypothetical protein